MTKQEKAEAKRARRAVRLAGAFATASQPLPWWQPMRATRTQARTQKNEERVEEAQRRKNLAKDQATARRMAQAARDIARMTAIQARRERRSVARRTGKAG